MGWTCPGPPANCVDQHSTQYRCSANAALYGSLAACQSACTTTTPVAIYTSYNRAYCPAGYSEVGSTPTGSYQVGSCAGTSTQTTYRRTCQATQYRCSANGQAYTDAATCSANCYADQPSSQLYQARQPASCPAGYAETGQTAVGVIYTSPGATTATACSSYTAQTVYQHACQVPYTYQCGKDGTVYNDQASCQTQCWQGVKWFDTLVQCQAGCTQSGWFCEEAHTSWDMQTVTDTGTNAKLTLDANSCAVDSQCQVTSRSCPDGYAEISSTTVGQVQCCGEATEGSFLCGCAPTDLKRRTCIRYTSKYVCRSNGTTCTPDQKPTCKINGAQYTDTATCAANCGQSLTCDNYSKCNGPTAPSGQVFFTPTECAMFCKSYACTINNKNYDQFSLDDCKTECRENVTCVEQLQDQRYKTTIRNNGSNDYTCPLDRVAPDSLHVGDTAYTNEGLILRQCVDRYDQAFLDFADPASGAAFKFSKADLLIYQAAASAGLLPRSSSTFVLPDSPPLYTAGNAQVPHTPQFPGKTLATSWSDDDSTRLGTHSVTFSNLHPLAYYWQCPQGGVVPGDSPAMCSAEPDPFGGVDATVRGNYCFQYKCGEADISPTDTTYSGCGYVNDGQWSTQ